MKLEELTINELLAAVLNSKPDADMVKEIITRYGSARRLYLAPLEELTQVKGIGLRKARLLKHILELGLRLATPENNTASVTCPNDAVEIFKVRMPLLDREHFVVMSLNIKNKVLDVRTVSIGSLNSSLVHPREVFNHSIKISAAAIILLHNHPSGDPSPSAEDISITRRLVDAGEIVGINVLDHIIIGNTWISFREKGLM